MSVFR